MRPLLAELHASQKCVVLRNGAFFSEIPWGDEDHHEPTGIEVP